jgi:hypothetical protein
MGYEKKWDMNVYGGLSGGRGQREGIREVKRMEICFIYTYEDNIVKPIEHCKWGGEGKGDGMENTMEG